MSEKLDQLLAGARARTIQFAEVISYIEARYLHTPTAFTNGALENAAEQNQGSAKVFAFAKLNGLSSADTLLLFAEHYQSVLDAPDAQEHQNIRQFMRYGWDGLHFKGNALQPK
ncbi:HopJ type III effector protein [Sphingobacterium griseoflavum]|uniref:HopJ type III effector protein n=1 Tax=Sphingobacterium griseoflavum TaxID=1474952 RepID=A0ABQ3HWX5_9SPHI|nr:HopJ type III effector protein [Sphingobacterium griseoflavum]GHE31103.1 hypothetical protein GCM10017764_12700 [Sphingobacterium griseoflavum]